MNINEIHDSSQLIAEPGIRPLLAALGRTPIGERDRAYRSSDHRDIARALAEAMSR